MRADHSTLHLGSARNSAPPTVISNQAGEADGELVQHKRTEQALRESEQQLLWLASIVESSDDAIVSKNLDGIITSWNKGAERIFGYAAEEAIGRPITIVIPADRHDEEREILTRIRRGGKQSTEARIC